MDEREAAYQRLEQRASVRNSDRWQDVVDIGIILSPLPERSPERAAEMKHISERTMMKAATIRQCLRVFEISVNPDTGEITLPLRLNWSTALLMAQKGAAYEELMRANDEGWTMKQARLWAMERAVVPDGEKPKSFWRCFTKAIPEHIRKATGPLTETQWTEFRMSAQAAWEAWNAAHEEP